MGIEEDDALKAAIVQDAVNLRKAAKEITESEEFKKAMAGYVSTGLLVFQPFLVVAASAGGPAAGMVAQAVGNRIAAALQAAATKET